ncbi:MAG: 4Fe-4S binding protein [Syntrophorhabdaceae bacterium]|jgi:NAD-dependent dihydropyrimidine dehydrogenase PreA subunit|nr:4Fe-4S binding protein [Syntrophorhabdaceae bacterium]
MKASYGYKDGSGDFFITIDTDLCNGCGACITACPAGVFVVGEDENDPLIENPVAAVAKDQRKKIKYACGPCKPASTHKPASNRPAKLPCQAACEPGAIEHSW